MSESLRKFKVGDKVKHKFSGGKYEYTIENVVRDGLHCQIIIAGTSYDADDFVLAHPITAYKLPAPKSVTPTQPFAVGVLVRCVNADKVPDITEDKEYIVKKVSNSGLYVQVGDKDTGELVTLTTGKKGALTLCIDRFEVVVDNDVSMPSVVEAVSDSVDNGAGIQQFFDDIQDGKFSDYYQNRYSNELANEEN